jgi:uncharacterized membrane protein
MKNNFLQDKDIEVFIGNLLRAGVIISSSIIIIGGIIYLFGQGGHLPDYQDFRGLSSSFHSLPEVLQGVLKGNGGSIIQLGVLVLIATPIARIVFSIFGFLQEKDRLYIFITLIVLVIIVSSMLFGLKG